MFWVVDNFLMRKGKTKAKLEERGANQDSRNGSKVRYRRAASHEESESEVGASLTLPKSLAIIPGALGVSALKFVPECWFTIPVRGKEEAELKNRPGHSEPH